MTCMLSWTEIDIHTKESFVPICCQKMVWIEELRNLNPVFVSWSSGSGFSDSVFVVTLYNRATEKWELTPYI